MFPPRRFRRAPRLLALLTLALVGATGGPTLAAADAAATTITGTAFVDADRNGVRAAGEAPFVDHLVYLYDAAGQVVATRRTDADGRYQFSVPAGTYEVAYAPTAWRAIWSDWVPTTTGSLVPEHTTVEAPAVADFGWRAVVRSDDVAAPISEFVGVEGLRVQSYNDVVGARAVYDHIVDHFRVGEEAPHTTVRFGYRTANSASTAVARSGGEVTKITSVVYSSYERWLSGGDWTLAHEYGHAWMAHHMYAHADDGWRGLLTARGIDPSDDRLGTSHAWHPSEIAAEDYRQLFASSNARTGTQLNRDIPLPTEVEGYATWLGTTFVGGDEPAWVVDPAPVIEITPEPEPEPASAPAPEPEPEPEPVEEPVSEPAPVDEPVSEPEPVVKGKKTSPGRWSGDTPPGKAKR